MDVLVPLSLPEQSQPGKAWTPPEPCRRAMVSGCRCTTGLQSGQFGGQHLNLYCGVSGPDGCVRTSTVETSSDAYLHRYFIRGVMGAPPHSVRIKIEHLSFQVRLNEHINNLESPSNVRGEAFVERRQTWVSSLMKETMAPTSESHIALQVTPTVCCRGFHNRSHPIIKKNTI